MSKNNYKYANPKFEVYKSIREPGNISGYITPAIGSVKHSSTDTIVCDDNYIEFYSLGMQEYAKYSSDWDASSSWSYRIPFKITHSAGATLSSYQVRMTITEGSDLYNHINSDGSDIRFYDSSGNELDYYIERYIETGNSYIWVELISITTSGDTIYMYFGNSGASTTSDLEDTMYHDGFHYADTACIACYHMDHHNMRALHFDATDDEITTTVDLTDYTDMSFSIWVNTDTSSARQMIAAQDVAGDRVWTMEWDGTQASGSRLSSYDGTSTLTAGASGDLNTGQWYHIAFTGNGTSGARAIYVNGSLANSDSAWTPPGSSSITVRIGAREYAAPNRDFWDGLLDEPKFWQSELTATEVLQDMRGENVDETNQIIKYDFEYFSSTTVFDLSGNGNNGTCVGGLESNVDGTFLADCPTCGSGTYHGDFYDDNEPKTYGTSGIKFGSNKSLYFDGDDDEVTLGAQDWVVTSEFYEEITLSSSTPDDDFQVRIDLTAVNFDYDHSTADGSDLRFYDDINKTTEFNYYIEDWNVAGDSIVWVKVPSSGTSSFYMFHGDQTLAAASSGDDTFELFDDFSGGALDGTKWTDTSNGGDASVTVAGGEVRLRVLSTSGTPNYASITSVDSFQAEKVVHTRQKFVLDASGGFGRRGENRSPRLNDGSVEVDHYNGNPFGYANYAIRSSGTNRINVGDLVGAGYFKSELRMLTDGFSFYKDDALVGSYSSGTYGSSDIEYYTRGWDAPNDLSTYIDYMFIRKNDSTDISTTVGSEVTVSEATGSISMWVFFDSHADDQTLFDYYVDADNYARLYHNNGDSKITFILVDATSTVIDIDSNVDVAAIKGWHYVAVTQDGTASKMYIDGIVQTDTDSIEWFDRIGAAANVTIGNDNGDANAIDGRIAEVKYWSANGLTAAEVLSDMKGTIPDKSDLLLYLNFKQISGTTAYDQSGNDNDGTISGAIEMVGDYPFTGNYCLEFDGSDDYVDLGVKTLDMDAWSGCTISAWAKTYDNSNTQYFFTSADDTGTSPFAQSRLYLNGTNQKIYFDVRYSGNNNEQLISNSTLSNDQWYHIVATKNSSGHMKIYINGVLDVYANNTAGFNTPPASGRTTVGSQYTAPTFGGNWDGRLDDVRVWSDEISGLEIQQVMNGDTTIQSGSLELLFNFQQVSADGTTCYDQSGNGNDGTISGSFEVCDDINIYDGNLATEEIVNDAIEFDGTDDYISLAKHVSTFSALSEGSIAVWFKSPTPGVSYNAFVAFSDSGDASSDFSMGIEATTGQLRVLLREGGTLLDVKTDTGGYATDTWHHFVYTNDSTGNAVYVDGIAAAVTYATGTSATDAFIADVADIDDGYIGANQDSGGLQWYLDGVVDEIRIYNAKLSASDVERLYFTSQRFSPTIADVETQGAYIYNKIPVGNVPNVSANSYYGDTYKLEFDFYIDSIDTDKIAYFALVTCDRIIPQDRKIWSTYEDFVKFGVYSKNDSGTYRLYFTAWDSGGTQYWYNGANWAATTETSTGDSLTSDFWYHCIIQRKYDRYRIDVEKLDGTEVEEANDLDFSNFTGTSDLRFSNGDETNRETADYLLLGLPIVQYEGATVRLRNIVLDEPIERITEYVNNTEVSNSINDELDAANIGLSNISENGPTHNYKDERWKRRVDLNDETEIYMGHGDDQI